MKTRFIVNLRSGRAALALNEVKAFAAAHSAGVVLTERAKHGSELARQAVADGCELIVAVGGDGTMNEIASALLDTGATFGLIPCGSGDGLGRQLGIHGTVTRALDILRTGESRLIDSGVADGHPFFAVAGIGFEAHIAERFNRLQRRGFLRYLSTSASAFRNWKPERYTIDAGDGPREVRAFTLAVANTQQYGNAALIAPAAKIDDGLIDLCAIPPVTIWNAAPLISRLFRGTLAAATGVTLAQSKRFIIQRPTPGPLHTDGELHEAGTRIEFTVRPKSLRIMMPGKAKLQDPSPQGSAGL
jgi:diacylglycerol kinase (ATP)